MSVRRLGLFSLGIGRFRREFSRSERSWERDGAIRGVFASRSHTTNTADRTTWPPSGSRASHVQVFSICVFFFNCCDRLRRSLRVEVWFDGYVFVFDIIYVHIEMVSALKLVLNYC